MFPRKMPQMSNDADVLSTERRTRTWAHNDGSKGRKMGDELLYCDRIVLDNVKLRSRDRSLEEVCKASLGDPRIR